MTEIVGQGFRQISDKLEKLELELQKFVEHSVNEQSNLVDTSQQTMTDIQRELAATFQDGRDLIQAALLEADTNAARRLDATINALNNRLLGAQASVLTAAEKARDSLKSAESSVIKSTSHLDYFFKKTITICDRLALAVELNEKKNFILSEELKKIARWQIQLKILCALNLFILMGYVAIILVA